MSPHRRDNGHRVYLRRADHIHCARYNFYPRVRFARPRLSSRTPISDYANFGSFEAYQVSDDVRAPVTITDHAKFHIYLSPSQLRACRIERSEGSPLPLTELYLSLIHISEPTRQAE